MNKKNVILIGYTLDACIMAREIAIKENRKVHFLKTGKLAYPLDDINDYISYEDTIILYTLGIDAVYKKLINSTYAFIPYEKLKFVNTRNGLISYPMNKASFDSAEEWEQLEFCLHKMKEFRETLSLATNFINIYKNFFPKWLYDSLLKYMGINKWGGIKQSQFSSDGLAKEINLSYLDGNVSGTVYKPINGYEDIANQLLDHPNIKIDEIDIRSVHKMLLTRNQSADIILADNRVDAVCNYTYGNFDRVKFTCQTGSESEMDEFIDINEGIVFTPLFDYWCATNDKGKINKIYSTEINELNYYEQSEIPMTISNAKLYGKYKKMLTLYSGKILDLSGRVVSTIR